MAKQTLRRLFVPRDISFLRGFAILAIVSSTVCGIYVSQWGERVERRVAHPVAFQIRHWLGKDPVLDPRLKVYAFDDSTLRYLDEEDLSLTEWAEVLKSFEAAHPKAVLIPKLFGTPRGRDQAQAFVDSLKQLSFPVISGAVLTPDASREPYPLSQIQHDLEFLSAGGRYHERVDSIRLNRPSRWNAIGPHASIRGAFSRVGHINYFDDFFYNAFFRVTETKGLPAAPLLVGDSLYFDEGRLFVGGSPVPTDRFGRILINLGSPASHYSRIFALKNVLKKIANKEPITALPEDAIVVILFMFSPNVHMTHSPFGPVPEGLVLNAIVNSVLTNQWIHFLPNAGVWVLFAGLLGGFLGLYLQGSRFWLSLIAGAGLIPGVGIALFAYQSTHSPWFFALSGFVTSGSLVFLEKYRLIDKKTRQIRAALDGLVPQRQLLEIIKKPLAELTRPSEHVTTIMFIDVIGFYLTAETQAPGKVFLSLKELLSRLTTTIHEFDGIVDKTTGDGMLCFFGYDYITGKVDPDHASKALACAIEIQRSSLNQNLVAHQENKALFPLRIGLNTGNVFIGDLGNSQRMDFTIIGHPINFAKRLESACEDYCIMLGATTYDLISKKPEGTRIKKKMLQIKHYQELVEGYEVDPVADSPDKRSAAITAYWQFAHKARHSVRWDVPQHMRILAKTKAHGNGNVLNFSTGGLAVELDQYLARGVMVEFQFDGIHPSLSEELRKAGITSLMGEIRWGRPKTEASYLHGLALQNLTEEQAETVQRLLRAAVSAENFRKTG